MSAHAQGHEQPFESLKWEWALRDSEIDPKPLCLALVMKLWANERGEMRPTIDQVRMKVTNDDGKPVSPATIKRWRSDLVKAGWLELVARGHGRGKSSVYRLRFPDGEKRVTKPGENRLTGLPEIGSLDEPLSETQEISLSRESPVESVDALTTRSSEAGQIAGQLTSDTTPTTSLNTRECDEAEADWLEQFRERYERDPEPDEWPAHRSTWDFQHAAKQLRMAAAIPW